MPVRLAPCKIIKKNFDSCVRSIISIVPYVASIIVCVNIIKMIIDHIYINNWMSEFHKNKFYCPDGNIDKYDRLAVRLYDVDDNYGWHGKLQEYVDSIPDGKCTDIVKPLNKILERDTPYKSGSSTTITVLERITAPMFISILFFTFCDYDGIRSPIDGENIAPDLEERFVQSDGEPTPIAGSNENIVHELEERFEQPDGAPTPIAGSNENIVHDLEERFEQPDENRDPIWGFSENEVAELRSIFLRPNRQPQPIIGINPASNM